MTPGIYKPNGVGHMPDGRAYSVFTSMETKSSFSVLGENPTHDEIQAAHQKHLDNWYGVQKPCPELAAGPRPDVVVTCQSERVQPLSSPQTDRTTAHP